MILEDSCQFLTLGVSSGNWLSSLEIGCQVIELVKFGNWLTSLEIGWHVRKLVGEFGYWSSSLDISGRVWKLVVDSCVGGDLLQSPTIWFLACVVGRVAGINGDIPCIGVQTVNVCD